MPSVKYMYYASNMLGMFVCTANIHSHHIRQSLFGFNLPRVRLDISKKFISFHGVQIWNLLPTELQRVDSPYKFKCELHLYLPSKYC